jgi:hypothetical protein
VSEKKVNDFSHHFSPKILFRVASAHDVAAAIGPRLSMDCALSTTTVHRPWCRIAVL